MLFHFCILDAQLFLGELSNKSLWEFVLEDDVARHLDFGNVRREEFLDIRGCRRCAGFEFDEGNRRLTTIVVLDTDDVAFINGFVLISTPRICATWSVGVSAWTRICFCSTDSFCNCSVVIPAWIVGRIGSA